MPLPAGFELEQQPGMKIPKGFQLENVNVPEGFELESNAQNLSNTPGLLQRGYNTARHLFQTAISPMVQFMQEDPGEGSIPPSAQKFARATETYGPSVTGVHNVGGPLALLSMLSFGKIPAGPGIAFGTMPVDTTVLGESKNPLGFQRPPSGEESPLPAAMVPVGRAAKLGADIMTSPVGAVTGGAMTPEAAKVAAILFGVPIASETIPQLAGEASVSPTPENISDLTLNALLLGGIGHQLAQGPKTFKADTGFEANVLAPAYPGSPLVSHAGPPIKIDVPTDKSGLGVGDILPSLATRAALAQPEFSDLKFRETQPSSIRPISFVDEPTDVRFQKPASVIKPLYPGKPGNIALPPGFELEAPEPTAQQGQISFAGEAGQLPTARQQGHGENVPNPPLILEPPTTVGDKVTGLKSPILTREAYEAQKRKANVQWGLTMPETPPESPLRGGKVSSGLDPFDEYQDLMRKMKVAVGQKDYDTVFKLQSRTEQIKNANPNAPGMPPAAPQGKAALRPAVNLNGRILVGNVGDTHADILQRNGINPDLVPHVDSRRGFVDITKPETFMDRQQAAKQAGEAGTAKAGGLDSQDLKPGGNPRVSPERQRYLERVGSMSNEEFQREWAQGGNLDKPVATSIVNGDTVYVGGKYHAETAGQAKRLGLNIDLVRHEGRTWVAGDGKTILDESLKPISPQPKNVVYLDLEQAKQDLQKLRSQNAVRELRTSSISETQPSGDLQTMGEEVRKGAGEETDAQRGQGQAKVSSGINPFDEDSGVLRAFWFSKTGDLIEANDHLVKGKEILGDKTPTPKDSDEWETQYENVSSRMAQRGYIRVIETQKALTIEGRATEGQIENLKAVARDKGKLLRAGYDTIYNPNESGESSGSGTTFYSGFPLKTERDRPKGELEGFWMHYAGHLLPETSDYQLAREVVDEAPKATPAKVSDAEAKGLEQDMMSKGFTKVIRQGSTYFVDENASRQQLTGLQNQAKAEGRDVIRTKLYSGLNPFDPDFYKGILNRFYGHGVERDLPEAARHVIRKFAGKSAPHHLAANEQVADRMIEYASADTVKQVNPRLGQAYKDQAMRDWIQEGINAGLYRYSNRNIPNSLINGQKTTAFEIRAPGIGHKTLLVRNDLAPEVKMVLSPPGRASVEGAQLMLDLATELQLIGPTDVTFHTANMFASIVKSAGKSSNYFLDLALRMPGPKYLDAIGRLSWNTFEAIRNSPQVQAELERIAKLGALRGRGHEPTLLAKGVGKVFGQTAQDLVDTGKWIQYLDAGGRLARNHMFDNLVEQGLAQDTPTNRREFINKMGQYNEKLMSEFQAKFRGTVSQFVVAGRTFNRNAMESILASNEFKAVSPVAAAKAKISNLISLYSTAIVLPLVLNYAITKTLFGRPGTPLGKIDTGKDDPKTGQPLVWDPMKLDLSRRGARNIGAEDIAEGIRAGDSPSEYLPKAAKSVILGQLHPWEGPPVRVGEEFLKTYAKTGRAGESILAALKAINPSITAYFKTDETTGEREGLGGVGRSLQSAVGYGRGKYPSQVERVERTIGKPVGQMELGERIEGQVKVKEDREPLGEMEQARSAGRAIENEARRGVELKKTLDKPTQQWIDSRKLTVPGYDNKLAFGRTKMYLNRQEEERLAELVKDEYVKVIGTLKSDRDFLNLPQKEQQEVFHQILTEAARGARGRLTEEIEQRGSDAQKLSKTRKKYTVLGQ